MVRPNRKIRNGRSHLTHKQYLRILSKPNWRRLQTYNPNEYPNPFDVPKPALKAKTTKRIRSLAKPKVYRHVTYHERVLRFPRGAILEEPSGRILDLAVPKKSIMLHARAYGYALRNRHVVNNINGQLRLLRRSRYQKYRLVCNTLAKRMAARERRARKKQQQRSKSPVQAAENLNRLAAPRKQHKPPPVDRGPKVKLDKKRLNDLSTPAKKKYRTPRPEGVLPGALVYEITERMLALSVRENPRLDPSYNEPGKVRPEALKAHASLWVLKLAEPRIRAPGTQTDVKAEAFGVLPRALTAWCSPACKRLAMPKKRK